MIRNHHGSRTIKASIFALATFSSTALMLTCLDAASAGNKAGEQSKAKSKSADKTVTRVINFPSESIGGLYIIPLRQWGAATTTDKEVAVAKDRVTLTIPPGQEVLLRANMNLIKKPSLVDDLAPDGIDALELKGALFDLEDDTSSDRLLTHIAKLTGLTKLRIMALEPSDKGLAVLKSLKKLMLLYTSIGKIDGSFMKDLHGVPIIDLDLSGNPIKSENLKYLAEFPNMRHLCLNRCRLEPQAMNGIETCTKLVDLNLSGNQQIRDDAMKVAAKLTKLQVVNVTDTGVTPRGMRELKNLQDLRLLVCSPSYFSAQSMAEVKHDIPHAEIRIVNARKPVNKETKRIFAPISR